MKKTRTTRSRVLETISSRHGTRDQTCKLLKKIYYSKSQSKQWEKGVKCASKYQDRKRKKPKSESPSGFMMHPHRNRRTTGQGKENPNESNQLLF